MTRVLNLLIVAGALIVGLAVHIRNDQLVTFDYYAGVIAIPLSWLLAVSLGLGFVVGLAACLTTMIRLRARIRKLSRQQETMQQEVANLKAIPINPRQP